jgi:anionic cell wall polymer biosynthesis LytR-Cps2A-Psr (LCP) family protein
MAGMEKIVDALGGLEVDVSANELDILLPDGKTKIAEKPGLQTLSTKQVMAYINSPAVLENTSRSERLGKILNACLKKSMNLDLNKMLDLVSELLNYVETNISLNDMLNFAFSAFSVKLAGMETARFPVKSKLETRGQETVVIMEDWAEEILAIHTFLYGAVSQPQPAQP